MRQGKKVKGQDPYLSVAEAVGALLVGRELGEAATKAVLRKPRMALLIGALMFAPLFGGIAVLDHFDKKKAREVEAKRLDSATYARQFDNLQSAQRSLTQLMTFVESQKKAIKATQDALDLKKAELMSVNEEQARLRQLAEADRLLVDSILAAQQERVERSVWIERLYGLIIGVIGTYLASGLLSLGKMVFASRKKPDTGP